MSAFADPAAKEVLKGLFARSVERFTLDNGLTVLHVQDSSAQLVSAQVWVRTGSIHEGPFTGAGLSHYLEHMLFKGTETRKGPAISEEVQAAGGNINAYTTFDRTVYHIDGPSEATSTFLDILADICFRSTLPQEEVQKERDVILREIDMGLDDPDRQVARSTFESAFLVHPYRHPVIGHREIFEAVTEPDLRNYYNARYAPNNSVLVLAGDITTPDARKLAEKHFSNFRMRRIESPYIPTEPAQLSRRTNHAIGDYNIVRGVLAFPIPSLWDANSPSLDILATCLGGGESSILWQRLREEQKLVHYIDTSCWNPGTSGLFWVSFYCLPENQKSVEEAVLETLEATAKEGIAPALLTKAVRQAIVGEVNSRKTMSGQAARLGLSEMVVGEPEYARSYFQRLEDVTPESVSGLIKSKLLNGRHTLCTLGPAPQAPRVQTKPKTTKDTREFEEVSLEGGATLLLQQDGSLPKVHCKAVCLGGPLYESNGQRGITELLSTMLTKDAGDRDAKTVTECIENVGGTFTGFGGNNTFGIAVEVLKSDQKLALDLLTEAIIRPQFAENTFVTERDSQVAELRESEDEIGTFGGRRLRQRFFGEHPYNVGTQGLVEDLASLTPTDISAHWQKLICPGNLVLSLSGDFDRESAIAQLETLSSQMNRNSFIPENSCFEGPQETGHHHEYMEREQAVVFQAYPDIGVTDSALHSTNILADLLNGMSSRLFNEVREKRSLAYYVGAGRVLGIETGMFYLYAGTAPDQAKEVYQQFDLEIQRLANGDINLDELSRSKARLKTSKRMQQQTAGSRALEAALNKLYGLPINDFLNYDSRTEAVKVEDIQGILQQRIVTQDPLCLTVSRGPK